MELKLGIALLPGQLGSDNRIFCVQALLREGTKCSRLTSEWLLSPSLCWKQENGII